MAAHPPHHTPAESVIAEDQHDSGRESHHNPAEHGPELAGGCRTLRSLQCPARSSGYEHAEPAAVQPLTEPRAQKSADDARALSEATQARTEKSIGRGRHPNRGDPAAGAEPDEEAARWPDDLVQGRPGLAGTGDRHRQPRGGDSGGRGGFQECGRWPCHRRDQGAGPNGRSRSLASDGRSGAAGAGPDQSDRQCQEVLRPPANDRHPAGSPQCAHGGDR